ncbi:MAG: ASKHA domain-containing protein [Candidatus Aminicenantales bacterium]
MKKSESHQVRFLPFDLTVKVAEGIPLLEAAKKARLPLQTSCGGKGTCGNCLIQVVKGHFSGRKSAALTEDLIQKGYALACRTPVEDDLTVKLPEFEQVSIPATAASSFFEKNRDTLSGVYEVQPAVRCIAVQVPPPSLENHQSDLRRLDRELQRKLGTKKLEYEYAVLKKLARTVRQNEGRMAAVVFCSGDRRIVIDIKASGRMAVYGMACDLGTTSVALSLVNLEDGRILETVSGLNQQALCGEDVIARINYAHTPVRLKELRELALSTVNHLIAKAVESSRISPSDIYFASLAGNTTMAHLFFGLEPENIRREPYVPTLNEVPVYPARELGLKIHPEARIYFAPSVGSYVGGDITAGLLCTPMLRDSEKISLFIDAGTNGEVVLGNSAWLMACACSAGPAFEGGGIRCGRPASSGSIERVQIRADGALEYSVIHGQRPKGLCGSGLVDLLSELFLHGYIDRSGKFNMNRASKRWVETERGPAFLVEEGQKTHWGRDLFITEKEIANLIFTKGAVFSACSLLLKNAGLSFGHLDAVFLAGGFGQSLNIENAVRIGLLPDIDRRRFHYLGNSSLLGACLNLISEKNRLLAGEILEKMTYIELNTTPDYMNEFTGALFLPHTDIRLFPSVRKALEEKPVKSKTLRRTHGA